MPTDYTALKHEKIISREYVTVQWTLFNICNFSCSYCIPSLNDGSIPGVDSLFVIRFLYRLMKSHPDQKFYFEFTGGEITHHRDFSLIFPFLKEHGASTGILSNGSKSLKWWEENVHFLDNVSLSFHQEQGDQEKFFEVANFLDSKVTLSVNVIMNPIHFEKLHLFAMKLANSGLRVQLQPVFKNISGPILTYTEEQKAVLLHPGFPPPHGQGPENFYRGTMVKVLPDGTETIADPTDLIKTNQNSWTGWTCMAGVENLSIDMGGRIFRGICREGGLIGSVYDPSFTMPSEGIVCHKATCHCGFDIMCSKYKP